MNRQGLIGGKINKYSCTATYSALLNWYSAQLTWSSQAPLSIYCIHMPYVHTVLYAHRKQEIATATGCRHWGKIKASLQSSAAPSPTGTLPHLSICRVVIDFWYFSPVHLNQSWGWWHWSTKLLFVEVGGNFALGDVRPISLELVDPGVARTWPRHADELLGVVGWMAGRVLSRVVGIRPDLAVERSMYLWYVCQLATMSEPTWQK
jgi:hypothetical protein